MQRDAVKTSDSARVAVSRRSRRQNADGHAPRRFRLKKKPCPTLRRRYDRAALRARVERSEAPPYLILLQILVKFTISLLELNYEHQNATNS